MGQEAEKFKHYLTGKLLVLSSLFVAFIAEYLLGIFSPGILFSILMPLLFSSVTWLIMWLALKRIDRQIYLAHLALASDLLAIVVGMYISGGPENPWCFLPMIVVVMSGYLFGFGAALAYALGAISLISVMFGLEFYGLVPHFPLFNMSYPYWKQSNYLVDYLCGMLVLYFLSSLVTGDFYLTFKRAADTLRRTAAEAIATQEQLKLEREELETRVNERTSDLEKARAGIEANFNERTRDLEDARRATLHLLKDLKEDMTKLQMVDRMKTEFMSMVSHELRTPLTPIKGYLSLIMEDKVGQISDQQREALRIVIKQSNHLQDLIDSLLDLSRLELGKPIPIVKEPTSIKQVFDDIIEAVRIELDKRQQDLKVEIVGELPAIMADGVKLKRILTNLVGNAIKFTPRGGEIKLRALAKDGGLRIEVVDNGIGIPQNLLERVFEKFYQIDSSYTREAGGIGMGLTIARELAELHGGRLFAESTGPGKGSKLIVELPVEGGSEHGS